MSKKLMPAEWSPHRATWLAWPCHKDLWQDNLPQAQKEFTALCKAIAPGSSSEKLEILVAPQKGLQHSTARQDAEQALQGVAVRFHDVNYGDIWMRDTGPIFMLGGEEGLSASKFQFNGWGGKYVLVGDSQVSAEVVRLKGCKFQSFSFVLEGGAIDTDGAGTVLTTRQCLLNPNRLSLGQKASDPELPRRIETQLKKSLNIEKVIWLDHGLLNDHTDGHVDNLARFVAPGKVICQKAIDPQDPNHLVFEDIYDRLGSAVDASGRRLEVVQIASVGLYRNAENAIVPASYMNFYISNSTVIVPQYGSAHDAQAVSEISKLFPNRNVVGLSSKALLTGGGSFHCITQQEPLAL